MPKASVNKKIINHAGFIKTQMQDLVTKLEEAELFSDAEELEAMLENYSEFLKRVLQGLDNEVNQS